MKSKDTEKQTIIYAPDPINLGKLIEIGRVDYSHFNEDFAKCAHCGSRYYHERECCPNCGSSETIVPGLTRRQSGV